MRERKTSKLNVLPPSSGRRPTKPALRGVIGVILLGTRWTGKSTATAALYLNGATLYFSSTCGKKALNKTLTGRMSREIVLSRAESTRDHRAAPAKLPIPFQDS